MQKFVPVVSSTGKALMPTNNQKANRLIAKGRAVRRFDRGLFYIQLLDQANGYTQQPSVPSLLTSQPPALSGAIFSIR